MFSSPRIRFQVDPGSSVVAIVFRGKGDFDGVFEEVVSVEAEHGRRKMRRARVLYQVYTETMERWDWLGS